MSYIARQHLRWGDGFLEPGDEVPEEAGRDYGAMLYCGEIAEQGAVETMSDDDLRAELARVTTERDAALAALTTAAPDEDADNGVAVPDGVVPGETPGWPLGVFVVALTDRQRAELADAGISGTLTQEDLVGLLAPSGDTPDAAPEPPSADDALPDGVTATGGGWFLLPGGTKVRGRKALDAALAEQ